LQNEYFGGLAEFVAEEALKYYRMLYEMMQPLQGCCAHTVASK
jgi:hypothetical protein